MTNLNYYYDNAATSFPKPKEVADAMYKYLTENGGTYGRSAYRRVLDSTMAVELCRNSISEMLNCSSNNIFFTVNATHASNILIQGLNIIKKGSVIAISPMEHNAVMRPLEHIANSKRVTHIVVPHESDGLVDINALEKFIVENNVTLLIINHQSNVNGVIQPLQEIAEITSKCNVKFMVDATQSIGVLDIDLSKNMIDYLIFTGHKNLYGPMGVGCLYMKDYTEVKPLIYGGTGSHSDSYNMPSHYPDILEAGTPNIPAIVGLNAALGSKTTPLHSHDEFLNLLKEIKKCNNIIVYSANDSANQGEVISITHKDISVADLANKLYDKFQIEVRAGLHCSPLAHRTLNTFKDGTVRISTSLFHTINDFDYLLNAIKSI